MTDPRNYPRTEAGGALLEQLESVGRAPYSGVSFLSAEDDIAAIEQEARRQALEEAAARVDRLPVYRYVLPVDDESTPTRRHQPFDMLRQSLVRSAILSETEG